MVTAAAAAMLMVPLLGTNQGTNTNLTVMSFYGTDIAEAGWLTLAMAGGESALAFKARGVPSLAQMPEAGVWERGGKGVGTRLIPQWQSRLERWAAEQVVPLMANGTVVGAFIGDELCCHNTTCWATVLVPLSVALRRLLGPAAILYENDCSSSITGSEDPVAPPPNGTTGLDRIAPELNYVSVDIYAGYGPDSNWIPGSKAGLNGSAEPAAVRAFAERELYPRMHPWQLLLLVPGTFACKNTSYVTLAESDSSVNHKLEAYFAWAKEDPRVAGFNPWHFLDRANVQNGKGPCDMMLGISSLPKSLATVRRMGAWIKANGKPPLS